MAEDVESLMSQQLLGLEFMTIREEKEVRRGLLSGPLTKEWQPSISNQEVQVKETDAELSFGNIKLETLMIRITNSGILGKKYRLWRNAFAS